MDCVAGKAREGILDTHPWDATCPDTFASSYESRATLEAGGVASRKSAKYAHLAPQFIIQPVAIRDLRRYRALYPIFSREVRQTHPLGHGRPPLYTVPPSAAVSSGTTGNTAAILGSTGN